MGSAKSNVPSAKDRYEANIARDSMGGNVAYQGTVLFQPIMYGIVYGKSLAKMVR